MDLQTFVQLEKSDYTLDIKSTIYNINYDHEANNMKSAHTKYEW